ncbi:M23 family metallopeptidase [Sphingomonas qomolangmaensis]|uniref:M23 family metallopeptidase n=1 Tax=Sphingomonas qomolangmaensis TaxID=2918765 RepID=A0ABY5LAQ8_9SPHN|nr:M23 family metallopeptidase [Sphingomonas qomolangmaensis]UUL82967.1 M23 family metallopeptidase [Sphingomonas qomolangmaensis]
MRNDLGLTGGGGASALAFGRAPAALPRDRATGLRTRLLARLDEINFVPDLGSQIGSRQWFRGAATCAALCSFAILLSPGLEPRLVAQIPDGITTTDRDELASQSIAPLAFGATTGRRIGATNAVTVLADTPERPIIELSATLGTGDALRRALARTGVGAAEAEHAADLIASSVALGAIRPGTRLDVTLGRRSSKTVPRPLEKLAFRARFDLALELLRTGDGLALRRIPIAIDNTPLRIRGRVGASLYRSARAAGAPARAVEAFIKSISAKLPMTRIAADDEFDLIVERASAATGEVQLGNLVYAGIDQGARDVRLVRWEQDGKTVWYDPSGTGERKGTMQMPVSARISSGFGWRRHPVLGFRRLHKGMDFAAPYGSAIRAASDGVVSFAGRSGGYGNFVKLSHAAGLATGYGHMSRIAVRSGTRVARGEVIGYVGSTGLSTGPHLHYELWRSGTPINPQSVSFSTVQRLSGSDLSAFRSKVTRLMAVPVGAARKASSQELRPE